MSGRRLRRAGTALTVLAGLALGAPAPARAQVYLERAGEGLAALSLQPLSGWSQLQVRGQDSRAGDFRLQETILAPGLHVATAGSVYHPRLLAFSLQGTGSLERRALSGAAERTDEVSLSDFDAACAILRDKPANLRLFADRGNAWLLSPYAASVRSQTTRWGLEARARAGGLPLTLSWTRQQIRQHYLEGVRRIDQDGWRLSGQRVGGRTRASFTVRRQDQLQNLQYQDFRTDGAAAHVGARAGRGICAAADARWLHRYGSRNQTQGTLGANLLAPLGHGLDARADYRRFRGRQGEPGTPTTAQDGGTLGLGHVLYGSLRTDLAVRILREAAADEDVQTSDLRERGADLRLAYTRRTAAGTLRLGWDRSLARRDVRSAGWEAFAGDEPHRLTAAGDARLRHPWVTAGSVVVRDESGYLIYREGYDYDLVASGPYTDIRRRPEGDIPDPAGILVDYAYMVSPDAAFDVEATALDARFEAKEHWTVWAVRTSGWEDLVAGDPGRPLWHAVRRAAGAETELGPLAAGTQYEVEEVTGARLRTWRLDADLNVRPGSRWRAGAGAALARTWTEDPSRTQEYLQVRGRARFSGRKGPDLDLQVWGRLDVGEGQGGEVRYDLFGARLQASHSIRQVTMEIQAAFQDADRAGARDRRVQIEARLRRSF